MIRQTSVNSKINHLAVWILVVVHQLIGWGWYAVFGEKWLNLHARTMTDIERTHNVGAYVFAIVTAIVVNYTLAWLISRLNATTAVAGLKIALDRTELKKGEQAKVTFAWEAAQHPIPPSFRVGVFIEPINLMIPILVQME